MVEVLFLAAVSTDVSTKRTEKLPTKKGGRSPLLGEKLDTRVCISCQMAPAL